MERYHAARGPCDAARLLGWVRVMASVVECGLWASAGYGDNPDYNPRVRVMERAAPGQRCCARALCVVYENAPARAPGRPGPPPATPAQSPLHPSQRPLTHRALLVACSDRAANAPRAAQPRRQSPRGWGLPGPLPTSLAMMAAAILVYCVGDQQVWKICGTQSHELSSELLAHHQP